MLAGRGDFAFPFLNTCEKSLEEFQKYQNGILIENEVLGEHMGSRTREKQVPYTFTGLVQGKLVLSVFGHSEFQVPIEHPGNNMQGAEDKSQDKVLN